MLEQLSTVLAGASFASSDTKNRASGLSQRVSAELAALGVVLTSDSGTATSVVGAVNLAKATVNAQAVSATFSQEAKGQALGKLDALGAQLASLGLS